jgi:hypothetical protein
VTGALPCSTGSVRPVHRGLQRRATSLGGVFQALKALRRVAWIATISINSLAIFVQPVQAYPIDCAILLCLAGGFPVSEPCSRAHTEMIRRITPWPIEPPVQPWNCPIASSAPNASPFLPAMTPAAVQVSRHSLLDWSQSSSDEHDPELLNARADISIADMISSIEVYHLRYLRHYSSASDSCNVSAWLRIGSYEDEWLFSWRKVPVSETPPWIFDAAYTNCGDITFRGVGMAWINYDGQQITEVIEY